MEKKKEIDWASVISHSIMFVVIESASIIFFGGWGIILGACLIYAWFFADEKGW